MSEIKSCPSCNRSYSDLSFSFCLADGALLSASYDSDEIQPDDAEGETRISLRKKKFEEPTLVKSSEDIPLVSKQSKLKISPAKKRELDSWKYEKSIRTKDEYPIINTTPTSDRPIHKWKSSDYVREITFQITGKHTFHAQENLEILRECLNEKIIDENKILKRSTWYLGKGSFESYEGKFTFDFQKNANPTAEKFIKEFSGFLNW
jgi:hypothetical protein